MNIFWFRRDLRLEDNMGLFEALNNNNDVLPIFIFDPHILSQLVKDDARITFIYDLLVRIQIRLKSEGKSLAVFYEDPIIVFKKLMQENRVQNVYTNHDYEPYACKRDLAVNRLLRENNIGFKTYRDHVIFERNDILKDDCTPYIVYTPYMKKWKLTFNEDLLARAKSDQLIKNIVTHTYPFLNLFDIGFEKSTTRISGFNVSDGLINNYEDTRNFPSIPGTSMLAAHLRFGSISIRQVMTNAVKGAKETFWNELIWREFFMQILWHFPNTINSSFRPKYDSIKWRNNEDEFQKWCEGKTGYAFVDAGMRELNATGYMHNRVRMVVASFLCKHLLIDWRWGETYFAQKLLDYEQSSNIGNWQWAAGSGVDAAPYFRIFNPTEQLKKFDKDFIYTKKWVPEFQELTYLPIVDHRVARERALRVYRDAVQ